MWLTCLLPLLAILAITWWKAGPNRAIGVMVGLSLLVPSWVTQEIFTYPVGISVSIAAASLGAYCLHREAVFKVRLVFVDWAMMALIATHICIDWAYQGFSLTVVVRAYGEWFVPYVAGRLAFRNSEDIRALLPLMIVVIIVFAITSAVQGLTGLDLAQVFYGIGEIDRNAAHLDRWGIHRAYGFVKNPNYFGVLQLLLFPWSIYAAARALNHKGPSLWLLMPFVTAVGVFFPMSRAAQGGLIVSALLAWMITIKRRNAAIAVLAITVATCFVWQSDSAINLIDAWGGDLRGWLGKPTQKRPKIKIGEDEYSSTSTSKRIHTFDLYKTAMRKAGLFGFGTEAVTGFPVNVPMGQQDLYTLKSIWTVDNAFLLIGLRFGLAGMLCFFVLSAATAFIWVRITLRSSVTPGIRAFSAGMSGVSIAMMLVLLTVWMPNDFGFWFVLMWGAAAGLDEGLLNETLTHHSGQTHHSSHRHRHSTTSARSP